MDHLAQPERDMQSPHRSVENKLPRGVIVVGDGLLFKHSLFRGLLFQPLVAFLFGLIGVGGLWLKIVKWMDLSLSSNHDFGCWLLYSRYCGCGAVERLVVRTDDPKIDLY